MASSTSSSAQRALRAQLSRPARRAGRRTSVLRGQLERRRVSTAPSLAFREHDHAITVAERDGRAFGGIDDDGEVGVGILRVRSEAVSDRDLVAAQRGFADRRKRYVARLDVVARGLEIEREAARGEQLVEQLDEV